MTQFSAGALEIEYSAGTWTSLNSRLRMPVTIQRGRGTLYEDVRASVLSATLDNDDGEMMPDLIGAFGYPNVKKGIRIRWRVTKSSTTYTRFIGWIQDIKPTFDDSSLASARVKITATDSLALLTQKKLRSVWTELALYAGRRDGTTADAYEPVGTVAGQYAFLTNYSNDAGAAGGFAIGFTGAPALSFGDDAQISAGRTVVVNPDSSDHACSTRATWQSTPLNIQFLFKSPTSHVSASGINYNIASFEDSGGTLRMNLVIRDNGGSNGLYLYSGNFATNYGLFYNLANSMWYSVAITQNAGNVAQVDVQTWDFFGNSATIAAVTEDIRPLTRMYICSFGGSSSSVSLAGFVATRTRTRTTWEMGFKAGNATVGQMMTNLTNACGRLPISFTQVGDWTALACTGDWSTRNALDVGAEICRTTRRAATGSTGIMFARPKDSQVLAIAGSDTHPDVPVATVGWETDMLIGTNLTNSVDQDPTRVVVQSPQVVVTAVDAVAEAAGESRELTVSTISRSGYSDATDIAGFYLRRNDGLRINQLRIDLAGPVTDATAALFDESGTNTGLYPTGKLRISGLPRTHFTYPTRDVHVQGWTEVYSDDEAYIVADCSPAQIFTRASDFFPGSDGAAWNAQWVTGQTGTGGTFLLASTKGRITPGTTATAYSSRRLNLSTRLDGELSGSFILGNAASQLYVWTRADSTLGTDGYVLHVRTSGTIVLERRVASAVTTIASESRALSSGTQYGFRIRAVGPYVDARVWTWGLSEQKAWALTYIDPSPIGSAGAWGVGAINDGTNATARTVDVDDILLTDAGSGV